MPRCQDVMRLLEPHVSAARLAPGREIWPGRLELLEDQTELLPDRIYLGDPSSRAVLGTATLRPGGVVLLAGCDALPELPDDWSAAALGCSLVRAVNLLEGALHRAEGGENAFRRFWDDVMDRRLVNRTEIREALGLLPQPVESYLHVVVVRFERDDGSAPYEKVLEDLRELLPDTNMTVYGKDIVLLYSHPQRDFRPVLEYGKRLHALLKGYNAYMMIGNGTRHAEALGSMYLLSKRTCDLARLLRYDREERIFYTEDYIVYSVLDLCAKRYLEEGHNEDVLYLVHPAVTFLTRHDREKGTNLRDVLFYYTLNDCNVNDAAVALFMHRNTVNNKVKEIKKLTGLELDDPRLRQRLLLSCQFMRYYEVVLQKEMQ